MATTDTSFSGTDEAAMNLSTYLSAVAVSSVIYDHLTHLDDEIADVWTNFKEKTWLKIMFLCARYSTEAFVIYTACIESGVDLTLTTQDCRNYMRTAIFLFGISVIGTESVVIYRLRSLWDSSRYVSSAIGAMFLFVIVTMITGTVFEVQNLPDFIGIMPEATLQRLGCVNMNPDAAPIPYMLLEAIVLVIWDVFNIVVFTSNTLSKPYQCSSDVFSRFKRDGGRYFVYLLAIRSIHLYFTAFEKESRFSAIPLACALSVIINARIFHRIGRDLEARPRQYLSGLVEV